MKIKNTWLSAAASRLIWLSLLIAALAAPTLADEVWTSDAGTIIYEKDIGSTAVFSYATPGVKNAETRLFIKGLTSDVYGANRVRGSYTGYWIDNSGRQTCEAALISPMGVGSRSWGSFQITFRRSGSWWAWTALLGDCFEKPSRRLTARPAMADSDPGEVSNYLITDRSAGEIRLGMTVAGARKLLQGAKFTQTICGLINPVIEVRVNGKHVMDLGAWDRSRKCDGNPTTIDERAEIDGITVYDSRYRTAKGVYPGMPLAEAEKIYGKVRIYDESEEGETAEFADRSQNFYFKVTGRGQNRAGSYSSENASMTSEYTPGAYIVSISTYK